MTTVKVPDVEELAKCRTCSASFQPTPRQRVKGDWLCPQCSRAYEASRRARRQPFVGDPYATGKNKRCSDCKHTKHCTEFYKSAHQWDGLDSRCKDCQRKRRKSPTGFANMAPAKMRALKQKWLTAHPDAALSGYRLRGQVRTGKVRRPSICANCGVSGYVEGHHENYSRPLDVTWLCRSCHKRRHHEMRVAVRREE